MGKNQEEYIGRNSDILPFRRLVGEVFPECKRVFFRDFPSSKVG